MARRQRDFVIVQNHTFAAPAATGDVVLGNIIAPTTGAKIVDAVYYVHTVVGAHTNGTIACVLEEEGTATALTASTGALVAETAILGVVGSAKGNNVGASEVGTRLQVQCTIASTVTTAGNWGVTVTWLT